ncbi:MAG TPA: thiol reductant ABC exporter subunit CydD [Burkholderiaceae bacterium]|nr:thiol reductant ABC exporter subunit CydD [Burkholderiaceae bacterium]
MPNVQEGASRSPSGADRGQSRWLSSLWRCSRVGFAWAILAPLFAGGLLVAQVWLLAQALGGVVAESLPVGQSTPYILGVVGLILVRAVLSWSGERAAGRGSETIKRELREALFQRLLALGPRWTRERVSGELGSTIVDQVEHLDGFFTRYLPSSIAAAFLPVAFGVVLLPLDWVAALILLASAPLIPVFMALVGWGAEAASRRHQRELTRLSGLFGDRLRGAFTLKLFGRADAEIQAVRVASVDLSRRNMAVLRIAFLSSAVLEFFAALGVAGVALYVGLTYLGYVHLRGDALSLPLGLFALFMAPEVYNPLRQFAANYHDRAAARAAVGQIAAMFDGLPAVDPTPAGASTLSYGASESQVSDSMASGRPPYPVAVPGGVPSCADDGARNAGSVGNSIVVHVRDLTIHAAGRERPVLRDASLDIRRGDTVALMGPSGSGKTTLLEALAGLRPVSNGSIRVLGRPVTSGVDPGLGNGVALLDQRPFFSSDSIADNLRMACPDADDARLTRALAQACAADFVATAPDGMQTCLGRDGHGLSGGQLHRLALARVFLLDPDLVLLDEPAAHLDAGTRMRVVDAILAFCAGRTLLIATHDLRIAARMGRVLHIERDGGLLERA